MKPPKRTLRWLPASVAAVALGWPFLSASAQSLDLGDEQFVAAAVVVATHDEFIARCDLAGMAVADRQELEAWAAANAADAIRARLLELEADPSQGPVVQELRRRVAAEAAALQVDPCLGALLVTRTPNADLASSAPSVLAALSAPSGAGPSVPVQSTQQAAPQPSQVDMSGIAAQIDSFGFDYTTTFGVGGFLALEVFPVVLFRSGDALTDIELLNGMTTIAEARQADPEDWTQWRRSGGEVQLQKDDGSWENLPFTATYGTLPPGFVLEGLYRSISGGGNVAMGGSSLVAAWSDYRFFPDGVVIRDQGAGGFGEFMDVSVAVSSLPPGQRGRYSVNGLVIHLVYDDGSEERRILVTDPDDEEGVIWLDGVAYSWRSTR